jgi:hypothetical protein
MDATCMHALLSKYLVSLSSVMLHISLANKLHRIGKPSNKVVENPNKGIKKLQNNNSLDKCMVI